RFFVNERVSRRISYVIDPEDGGIRALAVDDSIFFEDRGIDTGAVLNNQRQIKCRIQSFELFVDVVRDPRGPRRQGRPHLDFESRSAHARSVAVKASMTASH